ncbi:MAG: hypothetical protein M1829_003514 [Trizodia sp. TS-e1964]|nr:MAG: hypothetical protein M1829_003514 [Trizodia sp. TS-e1964]
MSLRITPAAAHPSSRSTTVLSKGAPSAPGLHDTLRAGLSGQDPSSDASAFISSAHPLEARLKKWEATQEALKMEGLRRTFGMHEPIRRGMELKIAEGGEWRPSVLGGSSSVHADILRGKDTSIEWEDVFKGDVYSDIPEFHTEMEARLRMNW